MSSSRPAQFLRGCVVVVGMALAQPAAAQLFFDWGGQEKVNDSGRLFVRIDAPNKPGEIIVSFSDRKLYYMTAPGMAVSYPIAIPREQDRWQGQTSVTQKRENPSWTPTPSMIKENPKLPRWVPGGHPLNPLGNRALYLGSSMYRIHGTDAPWTIGTAVSKGCIRMYNKDALDVYERSKVGAKVIVTWTAYKFTPLEGQENVAQQQPASETQGSGTRGAANAPQPAGGVSQTQPTAQSAARPATARPGSSSNVGRIYDAGGVEDFSARRSRRQADAAPDFSAPPQPSSTDESDRQARNASSQQQPAQQQRGDRSNRQRNATSHSQQPGSGQASSSRRTAAPAAAASSEGASSIETGAIGREVAVAPADAAPAAASAVETPRPVVRTAPARQPTQAQVAPAAASPVAAAPAGDDLAARALQAAERAAAAAERAAAAAERAERASRASSATAAPVPTGSD